MNMKKLLRDGLAGLLCLASVGCSTGGEKIGDKYPDLSKAPSRLAVSGDARVQYMNLQHRFNPKLPNISSVNERVRLGSRYKVNEQISFEARGDVEVGSQDTVDTRLQKGFVMVVDRAFLRYTHVGVDAMVGEYPNPLASRTWMDKDTPLEGASFSYTLKDVLGLDSLTASSLGHVGNALIGGSETSLLASGITAAKAFGDVKSTLGVDHIHFFDLDETTIGTNKKNKNRYASDFDVLNVSGSVSLPVAGLPVTFSGFYGTNVSANKDGDMFEVKASAQPLHGLTVTTGYRWVESDAIPSSFPVQNSPLTNFNVSFGTVKYDFPSDGILSGTNIGVTIAMPRRIDVPFDDQRQLTVEVILEKKFGDGK